MAASQIIKHWKDGALTLSDGTGTPVTLVVPFDNGDFTVSGFNADDAELKIYKTRGTKRSFRKGQDLEYSGSFSAAFADLSDAVESTLIDFVNKSGSYSGNLSTSVDKGDVYTNDLLWTVTYGGETHTITLSDCYITWDVSEGEPDSFSITFQVLGGAPTLT